MDPSAPAAAPVLAVRALAKRLPGGRTLFEGLDLTVEAARVVAIRGESGIGKSTLLNLIAGLDRPDAGEIAIEGVAMGGLGEDRRTILRRDRIGFVFQAFHVLPHLTLAQNVALPLVLGRVPAAAARLRAEAMLAAVGLSGRAADYPAQLSGGEVQRVAIARALVHRPALILADEPTGNLDPDTAGRILELLMTQVRSSGAAALIATHSERAAAVSDRTLVLSRHGLAADHAG
jgi:putative ABC transport system ATP-binding protein